MDCGNMYTLGQLVLVILGTMCLMVVIAALYIDYIIKAMNRLAVIQFGRPVYPITTTVTKK